jgi:hypothetical protein
MKFNNQNVIQIKLEKPRNIILVKKCYTNTSESYIIWCQACISIQYRFCAFIYKQVINVESGIVNSPRHAINPSRAAGLVKDIWMLTLPVEASATSKNVELPNL